MRRIRPCHGFTLIEVLVALAVVSVAVTVFFSLFTASIGLSQSSRNESVAATLAEEQLLAVCQSPGLYTWNLGDPGQLVEVVPTTDDPGMRAFSAPSLAEMPKSDADLYQGFSWRVFAKLPSQDAAYVEVTVAVDWNEAGRDKTFALTSTIARSLTVATGTQPTSQEGA